MSGPKTRAAAFDFDRTLTCTDSTKFLVIALLAAQPWRTFDVLTLLRRFLSRHATTPQAFKNDVIASFVRDCPEARVDKAITVFVRLVRRTLRQDVVARLDEHLDQGYLTIVATASPSFAIAPVFSDRRIHVLGADFEVKQSRYSGRILNDCHGEAKARRIRAFLESHALTSLDHAYSDHHSDVPLFALSRLKTLVYPDLQTKNLLPDDEYLLME